MKATPPEYIYKIDKAIGDSFEQMCIKLISLSKALPYRVIRMVFFGSPSSQTEYIEHLKIIDKCVINAFKSIPPVYSYVSQPPLDGDLILETTRVSTENIKLEYKSCDKTKYIVIKTHRTKSVFVGGIMSKDITKQSIEQQSKEVFKKVAKVLKKEDLDISDIVRQWNYIERITEYDGDYQNYQCLNDARTHFYLKDKKWKTGYPAATGIGTMFGGIIIDFDAVKTKSEKELFITKLDNKLQVPAHVYSQEVLLGTEDEKLKEKTTPKFERGKTLVYGNSAISYVSGTAAIRGEESLETMDIIRQTTVTMENIDFLISLENLKEYGVKANLGKPSYKTLRVYLKNKADLYKVQKYMDEKYPRIHKCYLKADVCREELLIEIEGIATY